MTSLHDAPSIAPSLPRAAHAGDQPPPDAFARRLASLRRDHDSLLTAPNAPDPSFTQGHFTRYLRPVLTADHVPLDWRYDLNPATNPHLLERLGINSVFNPGAIELHGLISLVCRVEGHDRKSFFAVADSLSPIDGFRFRDRPVVIPELDPPATNMYDMRLVHHEDGLIYGIFCVERPGDPHDPTSAIAQCAVVRTRDLNTWERLPDIVTPSPQQRNVVLHPEFVRGKYLLYTRPQDSFLDAGSAGGIYADLCDSMERCVLRTGTLVDPRAYHTIKEAKNGQGPAPIKAPHGWLHLAHGVRNTAAGLRYVLYAFITDLDNPARVTHAPGGYILAPRGDERTGDVSNVLFANGWIRRADGSIYLYYASSDTRVHVASTTVDILCDWCINTPPDARRSADCVAQRIALIERNRAFLAR